MAEWVDTGTEVVVVCADSTEIGKVIVVGRCCSEVVDGVAMTVVVVEDVKTSLDSTTVGIASATEVVSMLLADNPKVVDERFSVL